MKKKDTVKKKKKKRIIRENRVVVSITQGKDNMVITEDIILKIGKFADSKGYQVYIVGGYIRDYYLKRERTDFDFTVIGDAITFAKELAAHFNTKAVVFEKFRTAIVPIGDIKCEFVGTRKEVYLPDSRKPIVKEGTLDDDLRRRDFTCNAIAVSINKETMGKVIDKFNGKKDIDLRILRTPIDPFITFKDDPLRMIRAARFSSQLNFSIDRIAVNAIEDLKDRIKIVSQERISDELLKIIASEWPSLGFRNLQDNGLLQIIFPDLSNLSGVKIIQEQQREFSHKDVFLHSLRVLDNITKKTDKLWLRFAALVHDIAKPKTKKYIKGVGWTFHGHEEFGARRMKKIFRDLKFPMDKLPYVEKLVRLHQRPMVLVEDGVTDSAVRRLAFHAGEALEDLFVLCKADITTKDPRKSNQYLNNYDRVALKVIAVQEKDKLREFQSPIRGEEIMEICNLEPSRAIGIIKTQIEEAILDGAIPNEHFLAKEYFLDHKDEWLEKIKNKEWK